MDYNAPSGSTDPNAGYVGKTASTEGSKLPPKAAEFPQREVVHAIRSAGLTPSNDDLTQLIQAAARGIWLGTFGGTANALAATMPGSDTGADRVLIPQLKPGMRVRGIAAYANTSGTPKVTLTGIGSAGAVVQFPIVGPDGAAALPIPAWAPGQFLTFDIDASGNARFGGSGGGAGSGVSLVTTQTLWVRLDGNDTTGDGSANDAAHAFATIAAAVAASFKYQTTGGAVVIRLGQTNTSANPYAAPNATLNLCGRSIQILGDTSNKDSYVISGAGLSDGTGLIFVRGGILQVSGVRFVNTGTTSTTLAAADAGLLIADHCSFAMSGTNPQAHIGGYNGNVILNDGLNFASSAGSWLTISHGSALFGTGTITFTGTPNWIKAGVVAVYSALASPTSLGMPTISGSATGSRYLVDAISFIHTAGAGGNFFPGNLAGSGSNYD